MSTEQGTCQDHTGDPRRPVKVHEKGDGLIEKDRETESIMG